MKRIVTFLLCLALIGGALSRKAWAAPSWPDNVSISAEGGILMDANSGAVLYGKNIDAVYYPASITKIMTALVVLENCSLDDVVTFSKSAVYSVESGSSSAGMDVGDKLTVRDCLYAMMLKSANEVANALAEHTAGSIQAFTAMMNQRAEQLGCKSTHFNNPSGLNDPYHYTSAYDMALIAQAAFRNETFVAIDSSLYYDLPPTRRNPDGMRVYPGHRMMKKNTSQYYPGVIGGKTGYTSLAGNTLVTCAERGDMKLIVVILNGQQTHYTDTKALLDFGFANFYTVNVSDFDTTYSSVSDDMTIAGLPTADLSILHLQQDCRITLPRTADFSDVVSTISYDLLDSAPERAIARILYKYGDVEVGAAWLTRNEPGQSATQPVAEVRSESAIDESGNAESGATLSATNLSARSAAADAGKRSPEDSGRFRLHIPPIVWKTLAILLIVSLVIGAFLALRYFTREREKAERELRDMRRKQRLKDIGVSTADFDLLMKQKRSDSMLRQTGPARRPKKHKSFLDKKDKGLS